MTMKNRRAAITIAFTLFALCIIGVVSASILSENGKRPLYYLNSFTVKDEILLADATITTNILLRVQTL